MPPLNGNDLAKISDVALTAPMPVLPFDHPEPLAATLGVMFFPGLDKDDRRKARAFASQYLAEPLKRYHAAGHELSYDQLGRIAEDSGEALGNLNKPQWAGEAVGEMFKTLVALYNTDHRLVSWNNAIEIFTTVAARNKETGSSSLLKAAKRKYVSVAPLWAAWCIRGRSIKGEGEAHLDGVDAFLSFIDEAERLGIWGQEFIPHRQKARPLLPGDIWRAPDNWRVSPPPPHMQEKIELPSLILPQDLLELTHTAGRPRKSP